jgi:ammonia channel protein AmtB
VNGSSSSSSSRWTSRLLLGGTLLSAVCFATGLVLGLIGLVPVGQFVSNVGVLTILATPAVALVSTAVELRKLQPQASLLAVGVLGVLAVAVAVALFAPH